jgi:cystathionine gamma-synthase
MSEERFETRAIHVGQEPEPVTGAVITPIFATSTYAQPAPGEHRGYEYSRTDNPTRTALQTALASLEGVNPGDSGGCIATSSGLAATGVIGYMLRPGDHVVLPNDAYGGTYRLFAQVFSQHGIEISAADMTNVDSLQAAMRSTTKLVWVETPTNPMLRIIDIAAVSEIAHGGEALVCVDNTFASPYLQQPLSLGADIVLHSTTKYLGGHSDTVGGALITGSDEHLTQFRFLQNASGPVPGPFDAYLVLRGIKTLAVRMDRHQANAATIARFLDRDSRVDRVIYPGLESHPNHELAKRQMLGFGGMVSFIPKGGIEAARRVTSATEVFILAESLGGVESLIEVPALMTHMSVDGTDLEVPSDLIRLSVGIEHIDDLITDLDRALG